MKYLVSFYLKRKFKEPVTLILNGIVCILIVLLCNVDLFININIGQVEQIKLDSTTSFLYPYLEKSDNFYYYVSDNKNDNNEAILHLDDYYQIITNNKISDEDLIKIKNDLTNALRNKYRKEMDLKTNYYLDLVIQELECVVKKQETNNDLTWIICSLIYFLIITYGSLISNDIIYEKNSRILELQFTCIDAKEHFKAKIVTGYLGLIIQFLIIIVAFIIGISIRYRIDHFEGLLKMVETNGISYDIQWINIVISFFIILIGMVSLQIVLLILCSACSNGEQATTINSLFYIVSLIIYYYLLSNQSIDIYVDYKCLGYIPFISMYFETIRLCINIADLKEALVVLVINSTFLYLLIEVSLPIYKKNLMRR